MNDPVVTITVGADGPYEVNGRVRILAADGSLIEESERAWLCRCGASAKKPMCDGSHRACGFEDAGVPS